MRRLLLLVACVLAGTIVVRIVIIVDIDIDVVEDLNKFARVAITQHAKLLLAECFKLFQNLVLLVVAQLAEISECLRVEASRTLAIASIIQNERLVRRLLPLCILHAGTDVLLRISRLPLRATTTHI
jgi:hypothetical protein